MEKHMVGAQCFMNIISSSFSIVSENKVLKYLNSLVISKATGLDGILQALWEMVLRLFLHML